MSDIDPITTRCRAAAARLHARACALAAGSPDGNGDPDALLMREAADGLLSEDDRRRKAEAEADRLRRLINLQRGVGWEDT